MRHRKSILFSALFIIAYSEARSQYVRCFQRLERKSIDNYQPIAEFFYVTPHQCIDQCVVATNNAIKIGLCKSFVYNHLQHSCRLYDHSGNQIPAIIHPAIGYDLYKRTATTQECGGPLQRFFSQNLKIKHKEGDELAISAKSAQPIQQIQTPIQFGDTEELLHKQPKSLSPPAPFKDIDIEQGDVGAPASRPRTTQPNDQQKHNDESKKYGANFLVVSRSKPTLSRQLDEAPASHGLKLPSTLRPAVEYTQPCHTSIGFYLASGNEMLVPQDTITQSAKINEVDPQKCLEYCAKDTNAQNEPFKCLTLNYAEETKTCTLYGILAQPHGQGKLIDNADVTYAEKFCLPQSPLKCVPNAVFELSPDKLIPQNVIASTTSNNLADCLQTCLNTEGCLCSSFDSNRKQCLLHDVCSEQSQKTSHGWVLVSNGCQPASQTTHKITAEEWSSWSTCRYKLGSKQSIRIRTRKCNPACDGGSLQIERCPN